jgi:hypothetical protein
MKYFSSIYVATALFIAHCTVGGFAWATTPMVSAGIVHSCALQGNGGVLCWGDNRYGQLGNNNATYIPTPIEVVGIQNATAVAVNGTQSCATLGNGAVQCWGNNSYGQLGNGGTTNTAIPTAVMGINDPAGVSLGGNHTCALLKSGAIQCWGDNQLGQLGNGTTTNSSTAIAVSGISNAIAVSAGTFYTCAVLGNGTVQCWGDFGMGSFRGSAAPVAISGINDAKSVVVGSLHACALLSNGNVMCWGVNEGGQLGNGNTIGSLSPVLVTGLTNVTSISATGGNHTCALLRSGELQCWGANYFGSLGNGGTDQSAIPLSVTGVGVLSSVSAGFNHTCAMLVNSGVQCWGWDNYGQLGFDSVLGNNQPHATPRAVVGLASVTDTDKVFAWAERIEPQFFGPAGLTTLSLYGYRLRAYTGGHYLGVNESLSPHLFYLGPLSDNALLDLNLLSFWLPLAGP